MSKRIGVAALALLLAACAPSPAPQGPSPASPTTPSASPTPTGTMDAEALPQPLPLEGTLVEADNSRTVVEALWDAASRKPALKLDVTVTQATLTVLDGGKVASYRWADDVVDAATSDFEYFEQQTFDPTGYPLDSIGLMFDVADLLGVRGELVYQVQEYREEQVLQTVSSRPESFTVFFDRDATAVPVLGVTTTADIAEGLREVVGDDIAIREFGFSAERGYWAVTTTVDGEVMRVRKDGIPMFQAPSAALIEGEAFSARYIDPTVIARVLADLRTDPDQACSLRVAWSEAAHRATMTADCGDGPVETNLDGTPLPN